LLKIACKLAIKIETSLAHALLALAVRHTSLGSASWRISYR